MVLSSVDVLAAAATEYVQVAVEPVHPVREEIRHHVKVHPLELRADLVGLGDVRLDAVRPRGDEFGAVAAVEQVHLNAAVLRR